MFTRLMMATLVTAAWVQSGWSQKIGDTWFECRIGKDKDKLYSVTSGDNAVKFDQWQHIALIVRHEPRGTTQILPNGEVALDQRHALVLDPLALPRR